MLTKQWKIALVQKKLVLSWHSRWRVDRISYTGKAGWEMPHQLWLIKTLPRLSQTKQGTTRWLPELCTAKTTWHKKRRRHERDFTGIISMYNETCSLYCSHLQHLPQLLSIYSAWDSTSLVNGVFVVRVFALKLFPVIISIIPKIILDWSVNKNMKDADHFFFYTIDP